MYLHQFVLCWGIGSKEKVTCTTVLSSYEHFGTCLTREHSTMKLHGIPHIR